MNTEQTQTGKIIVPIEYRKEFIKQALKGEIIVSDFPEDMFPEGMKIVVKYPEDTKKTT